jgi:hypothetical protein
MSDGKRAIKVYLDSYCSCAYRGRITLSLDGCVRALGIIAVLGRPATSCATLLVLLCHCVYCYKL